MRKKESEVTDIIEIESIIMRCDVCRIAFADADRPYLITMNFGYSGKGVKTFYFHCAREGRKLDMIRKNNYVCFQLDTDHELTTGREACDFGMKYSSVLGYGRLNIIDDTIEKTEGLKMIMLHYTNVNHLYFRPESLKNTVILRLDISDMTAKRG